MHLLGEMSKSLDQGINFAVVNSLRTGNPIFDMLICLLVPVLLKMLLTKDVNGLIDKVISQFARLARLKGVEQIIEYTETPKRMNIFDNQSIENTDRNYLLQKAIRLYIHMNGLNIQGDKEVSLVPHKSVELEEQGNSMFGRMKVFSGSYQQLDSFAMSRLPVKGTWTLIDRDNGIYIMVQVNHNGGSPDGKTTEQTQKTTIFRLKAYGSGASDRLNAFVDKAFAWLKQKKQEEQLANNKRMFFLAVSNEKKDNEKKGFEFKQYPLSDHKTFKSLFFPEKEALMSLVEDFMNRRGKFCIEGFPQKLGILLDGPPGTGKTSLIKALAQHTNRHIVSVNLAKVKTNQELMDLMFDLVFPVHVVMCH